MVLVTTSFEVIVIRGTAHNCRLDRVNARLRTGMEINVLDDAGCSSKCVSYNQCPKASLVPDRNKMFSSVWGRYRKVDIASTHPTNPDTRQSVAHTTERRSKKCHPMEKKSMNKNKNKKKNKNVA